MRLGGYLVQAASPLAALEHPLVRRLKRAWPAWTARPYRRRGGQLLLAEAGAETQRPEDLLLPALELPEEDAAWLPPARLPCLAELLREDRPADCHEIRLRHAGPGGVAARVPLPLGLGPCYALGPRAGTPSSEYGQAALDTWQLYQDARSQRPQDWSTPEIEAAFARLIFLAVQQCHHVTEELWPLLEAYDDDEVARFLLVAWGSDPKASPAAAAT